MLFRLKAVFAQYLLGLGFALLIVPIENVCVAVLPNIGWHFLTIVYVTIIVFQILFYHLTTCYNPRWTTFTFLANFVLWVFEQVQIEKKFHDSFIYQRDDKIYVLVLGALLWVTNKVVIDHLVAANKSIIQKTSRINTLVSKWSRSSTG